MKITPRSASPTLRRDQSSLARGGFARLLLTFCGLVAVRLAAQSTVAPDSEDEIVELSPFTVNAAQDSGYITTDTVSGGRLSMNLLQSPNDVTALTREFLDDIGAVNLAGAAVWLTSAAVEEPADNRDFGGNVTFRGLSSGGTRRDFFPSPTSVENYITQRLEGARGPNSIIYGDAASGGLVNVVTKRAEYRTGGHVLARFDSEGSRIGEIDYNLRASAKLALRVNAFAQDRRSWMERFADKRKGAHLAATLRPWAGGEFRLDAEVTRARTSDRYLTFADTSSLWDRQTVFTEPRTTNFPTSSGTSRFTVDKLVMSPSLPGVTNFRLFGRTFGSNLSLSGVDADRPLANFPVLPRKSFRIAPNDYDLAQNTYNVATFFEQKFGALNVEVAAARVGIKRRGERSFDFGNNTYIDIIRNLPDGSPNPNFGKVYSEYSYVSELTPSVSDTYRVAAAYELKFGSNRQIVSALASRADNFFSPRFSRIARTKDPTNPNISTALSNAANQIWYWRYWDQPDAPFTRPTNTGGYEWEDYVTRDTDRDERLDTIQINTVGYYFNNRVALVAGFRSDRYDVFSRTGQFLNGRPNGNVFNYVEAEAETGSIGLTYFPWRDFGFFANYSEGFTPQSDENPWIGARGPQYTTNAKNHSGGLRLRLFDGKIVGSIGFYDSIEQDRMINVFSARNQINAIWTALDKNELTIEGPFSIIKDTLDYEGRGWEVDLTANLGKRFRLRFNLAFPTTRQSNALPDLREYIAKHKGEWEAAIKNPDNPDRTTINNNYVNLLASITSGADGRSLNGTYQYRGNVFGNYEIQGGPLKGLRLGGGANLFGRRLIGNAANNAFDYIYAKEHVIFSAVANYSFKVDRQRVSLALNVFNLFDYDEPVYTSTSIFRGVAYRGGFYYNSPRTVQLTATMPF